MPSAQQLTEAVEGFLMSARGGAALVMVLAGIAGLLTGARHCQCAPTKSAVPGIQLEAAPPLRVKDIRVQDMALLPDNETAVLVGSNAVEVTDDDPLAALRATDPGGALVNLRTKAVTKFLNGHTSPIHHVAVSAGGQIIATTAKGLDPKVRIWDVKRGRQLDSLDVTGSVRESQRVGLAGFRDSSRIAVALAERVSIFGDGGKERVDLPFDHSLVTRLVLNKSDRYLAGLTFSEVLVWDLTSKKVIVEKDLTPKGVDRENVDLGGIQFGHRSDTLYVSRGRNWGTSKGDPPEPPGLLAIDIERKTVRALDFGTRIEHFCIHPTDEWLATVSNADPDKPFPSGIPATVGEVRVYHVPSGTLSTRVQTGDYYPMWVAFTANGETLVAVDPKGEVRSWSFGTSKR
jgi:WD40 repeat protein